jgi:hypothetical protein
VHGSARGCICVGRHWAGEREVLEHAFWRLELCYSDHRGTVQQTHHPDLAVRVINGLVAVEVELQRKAARRQRGICAMYQGLTDAYGPLLAVCRRVGLGVEIDNDGAAAQRGELDDVAIILVYYRRGRDGEAAG